MELKIGSCQPIPSICLNISKEKWQSESFSCHYMYYVCVYSTWLELPPLDIRKLRFLHRVMTNEKSICRHTFSAMVDDVEELAKFGERM